MKRLLRILFSLIALKTQRVSSSYILLHTLSHAILKDSIRTGLLVSPRVCSRGRRGGGKKGGRKLSKDLLAKSGGPLRPRALEDADWARNRIRSCAALRGAPPSSFLPSLPLSLSARLLSFRIVPCHPLLHGTCIDAGKHPTSFHRSLRYLDRVIRREDGFQRSETCTNIVADVSSPRRKEMNGKDGSNSSFNSRIVSLLELEWLLENKF